MDLKDLEIVKLTLHLERERQSNRAFMDECLTVLERRKAQVPIDFAERREGE